MQDHISLIIVNSRADETEVLRNLPQWRAYFNMPVAPVLNRSDLPARIVKALTANGLHVATEHFAVLGRMPEVARPDDSVNCPKALFSSKGLDAGSVALAATLCGTECLPVSLVSAAQLRALPAETRNAVVLINPEVSRTSDMLLALELMAAEKLAVGMIYATNEVDARFAILKSLLIDCITGRELYSLLSPSFVATPSSNAPHCLHARGGGEESRRIFEKDQDVLLLGDHSGPLDASLGSGLILCSREGENVTPSASGLFPCFADGKCFRRHESDADPHDRAGLIPIRNARARIIILSGCNFVALGQSWFSTGASLTYQGYQGNSLAILAASSALVSMLELDFLSLALIAQGLSLGEVANEINKVRSDVHGHATGLPRGVGPFVLLGNPCLRLKSSGLQEANPAVENGTLRIDLQSVQMNEEIGALVRVPVPAQPTPFLLSRYMPPGVWCHGIWHQRNNGCELYLWLGSGTPKKQLSGDLIIELFSSEPFGSASIGLARFIREMSVWTMLLDSYLDELNEHRLPTGNIEEVLTSLNTQVRSLSRGLVALQPAPGTLDVGFDELADLFSAVWAEMSRMAESLLECTVHISCVLGSLHSYGTKPHYRRGASTGPIETCVCGEGIVWGQQYVGADPRCMRVEYQCGQCGPIGEDDGRRLVRLTEVTTPVKRGQNLNCVCECRSPEGELTQIHLVPVFESWSRDRRIVGNIERVLLNSGETTRLNLSVTVPGDISQGVFPLIVIGTANGSLFFARQFVQVLAADDDVVFIPRLRYIGTIRNRRLIRYAYRVALFGPWRRFLTWIQSRRH